MDFWGVCGGRDGGRYSFCFWYLTFVSTSPDVFIVLNSFSKVFFGKHLGSKSFYIFANSSSSLCWVRLSRKFVKFIRPACSWGSCSCD